MAKEKKEEKVKEKVEKVNEEEPKKKLKGLDKIQFQNYSLSEELISSISHGIGALLSIAALVLCVVVSAYHKDPWAVVSSSIYGTSLILLYIVSTIYHALANNKGKKVFRILDHCSIYLLIAGSYTPYTLVTLRGPVGWTLFGIVWGVAVLGIVLNAIDMKKFKTFSLISYIAMGWAIIFSFKPLCEALPKMGLYLLLAGGIAYTIGAIIYATCSKKVKYMHSLWHLFVLAGSILQFFSIFFYVI